MDISSFPPVEKVGAPRASSLMARTGRSAQTLYFNTINALLFLSTGARHTFHEGRYRRTSRKWVNWNREYSCHPRAFALPETEPEICRVVKGATRLRVVGGGHSFNASPLTNETLLSLD